MTGRLFSIAVLLALTHSASAQTMSDPVRPAPGMLLASYEAEHQVVAGRALMMSFQMDAADSLFSAMLAAPGNDEAALYHLAAISFLKSMFEQHEPLYEQFFVKSDALMERLDALDDSPWSYFFSAENYIMRAFVHARKGDFLRSAVSAKAAYEGYLDCLRADPTLIDAETGIGLLKALIGATPPAYKRFLKLLGYTGTIEEGIRLLDHAANKARYNGTQAALFRDLTRVYMNKDRSLATRLLEARYGEAKNPATGLILAFALRFSHRPEEAVAVAREAIAIGNDPRYMQLDFLYFHLGSALFSLNSFGEAEAALRTYVERYQGQSYVATARVRLGISLEMLDRREEAAAIYRGTELRTQFDIDVAAKREADHLLAHPLTDTGKHLLRARNDVSGSRIQEAIAELEPVFYGPESTEEERLEAAYYLGRAHQLAGRMDEAATSYVYVRTHSPGRNDNDERWTPWATYQLARIRQGAGEKDEARNLYKEVLKFKGDYDYKKTLRRNAYMALDEL